MSYSRSKNIVGLAAITAAIVFGGLSACGKSETSATLLAEAKQFEQKGDHKAAIIQLKNALSKNPEDAAARLMLGTVYNATGDAASAEKELRKAISLKADPDDVVPALATSLLAQQQYQKVIDETDGDKVRVSVDTLNLRGSAFLGLGQLDKAKEAFDTSLSVRENNPAAMIGLARYALLTKDVDTAVRLSDDVVAKNPKSAEAWMFKGALSKAQGKVDAALQAYDHVLAIDPAHRSAHLDKANVEIATGKFDAAKLDVAAARKATPNNLMVVYTQALLDFSQNKHAAARESLQKVLRSAPNHMPSLLLAGAVEFNLDSMPQAEQHLKKYLESNSGHLYARKLLTSTYLKMGRTADAIATIGPVVSAAQADPQALALAGEAYMQKREFNRATEYFQKATALAPEAASLRTSLAMSKLGQGDSASAISDLEASTKLDAKSSKAGLLLVVTEMRLNHFDKALVAAKSLEASQPNDPTVHNLKGGIYLGKKEPANARASFEKALALQPTYFPAASNLAQMSLQENKPEAARALLLAFLEKDKKNVEAMSMLARLAVSVKKPEEATQWLERASNDNPEAVAPAMQLAAHYLRTDQKQKAQTLARKFVIANPDNADVLDMLGQTQLAHGDQQGALETYSKLVNVAPKSALAQMRLAAVQLGGKNEAAAAESLKKAVALEPDNADAKLMQAELLARKGSFEPALALARQVQKLKPKEAIGLVLEGNLLTAQGKPALAVGPFEQALALDNTAPVMVKLHGALRQSGKAKEAGVRLAQWQKDHPADSLTVVYDSELDLAAKDYKSGIAKLEAVNKRVPGNPAVLNNLAWAYQQVKDPRALATAEQAAKAAPDSAAVMDTLGWMLVEQGSPARGLPLLQKAAGMTPDGLETRYHLAVALHKTGDKAGARKELEQLVSSGKAFPQIEDARALLKQL